MTNSETKINLKNKKLSDENVKKFADMIIGAILEGVVSQFGSTLVLASSFSEGISDDNILAVKKVIDEKISQGKEHLEFFNQMAEFDDSPQHDDGEMEAKENNYAYDALDEFGKQVKGNIEADSQKEALVAIRSQGMFPINVSAIQ